MALLFAADRMDHVEREIEPYMAQGVVVVSDRYVASSLAYQSLSSGVAADEVIEWIRTNNRHARGEAAQLYEQDEMQRSLATFYRDLPRHMPTDRIARVDGTGTLGAVEERVWAEYRRAFG
jgi:dTMP kinase